ncbi:helix-turn-helix domain-containing protein [Corynebacterium sp. CCM 9203]
MTTQVLARICEALDCDIQDAIQARVAHNNHRDDKA